MKQSPEQYILACMELLYYAPEDTVIIEQEDGTLVIAGDLNLDKKPLTSLPEGLSIAGILSLWQCTALTALPGGLRVGKDFNLWQCTALTSLPNDLKVGLSLHLKGCTALTTLPEGLSVGRTLWLDGCTLYPFDESKYEDIAGEFKTTHNSIQFIMEE